jgi:hypothetical protein
MSVSVARSRWILGFNPTNLKPLTLVGIKASERSKQEITGCPKELASSTLTEVDADPELNPGCEAK